MSSDTYPNCGYVIKVTDKVLKKLGLDRKALDALYGEKTTLDDMELFEEIAIDDNAIPVTINGEKTFAYAQNITVDDYPPMDYGAGWFFVFEEVDLFKKTTTELGKTLKLKGIMPKLEAWATYG